MSVRGIDRIRRITPDRLTNSDLVVNSAEQSVQPFTKTYGIIDLFAGIGGVANGFRRQGNFEAIALVDTDIACKETFSANYPDVTYITDDVRNMTLRSIKELAQGREIDGIVGCPPCQGYSEIGKRDLKNPLNELARDYFAVVRAIKPRFLVLENVPDILEDIFFRNLLDEICHLGYRLWVGILNAALYGVPQTRQRAIVMGYRADMETTPSPPEPSHFGPNLVYDYSTKKMVDLGGPRTANALGMCPAAKRIDQKGFGFVPWLHYDEAKKDDLKRLPRVITTSAALGDLPLPLKIEDEDHINGHSIWGHKQSTLDRMKLIPAGGDLADAMSDPRYFSQAYARLHPDGSALTISTNFHNAGCGRFTHYIEDRCITIREAARLQTVSDLDNEKDGFRFIKAREANRRMVGNAFPTLMAKAIAEQIWRDLGPKR